MAEETRAAILGPMRLPFLILTPACVLLGISTAVRSGIAIHWGEVLLVLLGALAAHICVNALNEYHDFKSGLDLHTTRTPFSGGSGTLPSLPHKASVALTTGLVALAVTALVGVYFLFQRGLGLLPLGLLGLLILVVYTPLLTRNSLPCLVAPGLGFGPLMVMGTGFALTGSYTWTAFLASLIPFFLVSNLLLLNQFPDVEADRSIGRSHLPIRIGRKASVWIYGLFMLGAYLSIVLGAVTRLFPVAGLLGLLTIFLAVRAVSGASRHAEDIPALTPSMGLNVVINILTPILLAVGLFIGF